MTGDPVALRLAAARDYAAEAGTIALRFFADRDAQAARAKGIQDVVTEADLAVERFLCERIADVFPEDSVLGEEGGGAEAEQLWIVDPIDGTANFARGKRHWCVSIAYAERGRPVLGVIAAPAYGETWWAREGGGAYRDGVAIRTSGITDARQATLEIGWTPRRSHAEYIAVERRAFDQGMLVHRCGSAALGVAFVADGRIDAFAELHANSWDIAAGDIIAREAGAFASDFFTLGSMTSGNSYLCCTEPLAKVCSSFAGFG